MHKSSVSVIIPVYNVEAYISECLTSVLKQTYRNIEIIIVDDCSNDRSFGICSEYAKSDNRIILLKNEKNFGVSYSRNRALENATGEYVIMVDSDDWLDENAIEIMVKYIEGTNADSCVCGYTKVFEGTNKRKSCVITKKTKIEENTMILDSTMRKKAPFVGFACGKLYRKKYIDQLHLRYDETILLSEDSLFNYIYFHNVENCVLLKECLWYYRIRLQSASHLVKSQNIKTRLMALQKSLYIAENYPDSIFLYRIKSAIFISTVQYINSFYINEINIDKEEFKELMLNAKEILKSTKFRFISKKSLVYYGILCCSPELFKFIHNIKRRKFK